MFINCKYLLPLFVIEFHQQVDYLLFPNYLQLLLFNCHYPRYQLTRDLSPAVSAHVTKSSALLYLAL